MAQRSGMCSIHDVVDAALTFTPSNMSDSKRFWCASHSSTVALRVSVGDARFYLLQVQNLVFPYPLPMAESRPALPSAH